MDKKFVYADNAATTRVSQRVLDAMLPYYREHYGNPSALYSIAAQSKEAVDKARAQVAAAIHAEPDEIYFVSCGTEADNWAIKGAARANKDKGAHFISTPFEHHAVLHSLDTLVKESGAEVTYLPVYENGVVKVEDLFTAIRPDTVLVTVMFANNEIGTVQPISEIGALCRERGVLFHTDAVQAVGHLPIDVKAQNIDMLSMSGHKFHGPKGCGVLYIRRGVKLPNFMDGGGQEKKRRAGTENVAQIVGIGEAIETACGKLESEAKRLSAMRDRPDGWHSGQNSEQPCKWRPHAPSARQRQCLHRVCRGRVDAHAAEHVRHLRRLRLRLHLRQLKSLPCADRNRPAGRGRPRLPAADLC